MQLSNFHHHVNRCPTFGTAPKHVAPLGHVEQQDKFSSVFWSNMHSHVMGNVTLTRISSKLPVARSWPRPSKDSGRRSPKTSDVTECQTTLGHDPTCGEVCLQLLRQSTAALTSSVCAFLSNMRRNWHAGRAALAVFLHCVGRQTSQLLVRSEVVRGRASPFFSVPVNATYDFDFFLR